MRIGKLTREHLADFSPLNKKVGEFLIQNNLGQYNHENKSMICCTIHLYSTSDKLQRRKLHIHLETKHQLKHKITSPDADQTIQPSSKRSCPSADITLSPAQLMDNLQNLSANNENLKKQVNKLSIACHVARTNYSISKKNNRNTNALYIETVNRLEEYSTPETSFESLYHNTSALQLEKSLNSPNKWLIHGAMRFMHPPYKTQKIPEPIRDCLKRFYIASNYSPSITVKLAAAVKVSRSTTRRLLAENSSTVGIFGTQELNQFFDDTQERLQLLRIKMGYENKNAVIPIVSKFDGTVLRPGLAIAEFQKSKWSI